MGGEDPRLKFNAVVAPHLSDALALARWLSGNQADAEDIAQEACLRAYRGLETYRGENARAWLLTIVRRTAYSWFTENRKPELVAVDDLKFSDRLVFIDPDVALQAFDVCFCGSRHSVGQLRLATAWWSFD